MRYYFKIAVFILFSSSCQNIEKKTDYYSNGKVKMTGNYVNGKPHGLVTQYFEDGKSIRGEFNYVNGKLVGMCKEYYQNGVLKRRYHYENDTLNGETVVYYPDGSISKKFKNLNGNIEGELYEYDTTGVLHNSTTYVEGKEIRFKVYYPNGKLFLDEERNGDERHGDYIVYYEDGITPEQKGKYRNNKRNGWFMNYFPNAQLKDSVLVAMGKWVERYEYDSLGKFVTYKRNE